MPTTVTDDPLGLSCVFSDGSRAEFDLTGSPNPRLVRDLAIGLVELIHPHGSADTAGTVDHYVRALHRMVRALADQGFTEFVIPVMPLAVVATIAALAGVAASILPARRAARLNVLDAIAS